MPDHATRGSSTDVWGASTSAPVVEPSAEPRRAPPADYSVPAVSPDPLALMPWMDDVHPALAKPDAAKSPGLLARAEQAVDHALHGSQAQQVAKLSESQRADYDAMLANSTSAGHPIAPAEALEKAKSGRPLTAEDRTAVIDAQHKVSSMKVNPIKGDDPNQVQMEVSFDGTWNDRDEMAYKTNPALINELFDGPKENKIYETGVGTSKDTKLLGGAFGLGLHERVDDAYEQLVTRVNAIQAANPKANVTLAVSGFSRGAAAARSFTNELNRRGVPDLASPTKPDGTHERNLAAPQIGAMMLYDTVGSVGLPGDDRNHNLDGSNIDLSIPANAQNVLQLTARDEKREAFPLSSVVDPSRDDPRIHEISLPGAHSDIGGSYANGYSQIPLDMGVEYLKKVGFHMKDDPRAPVDVNDPALRLHESRSAAELAAEGPDHQRKVFPSSNPQR